MSPTFNRRQAVASFLRITALVAAGVAAGCSGSGLSEKTTTASIGGPAGTVPVEREPLPPAAPPGPAKVALLLPLTGSPQTAAVALAMRQSAEMALLERQGVELQLIVKDDKGTEAGAQAAAREAIGAGAELILGPLFSKSVAAMAPIAREAKVPVVAFSNDPAVAGKGVYLLSFSEANEVARAVAYAAAAGRRRFAAFIPDDAEGQQVEAAFQAAVAASGASVAVVERYKLEANGMIEPARRLKDALAAADRGAGPVDALYLPAGQETLGQLAALLTHSGVDTAKVRVIGSSGWDFPNAQRSAQLHGGWFAAPDPSGWTDFAERFGRAYQAMPPRIATLSHDAIVMAAALAALPKGERYTQANLMRPSGFPGADGLLRFLPSGLSERELAMLELQRTGPTVIDRPSAGPAPGSPMAVVRSAIPGVN